MLALYGIHKHGLWEEKLEHGSSTPKGIIKMNKHPHPWHHRPEHIFRSNTFYIVTAGTYKRKHYFNDDERLCVLQNTLFEVMESYGWQLQAWSLFSNHYHFIAQSYDEGMSLRSLIQRFHSQSARLINLLDDTLGRKVWFQYWDTCLTYEKSYFARLNYVHNNSVKHGLVANADQYPYCSSNWFREYADSVFRKKVESFRYDQVKIQDDY